MDVHSHFDEAAVSAAVDRLSEYLERQSYAPGSVGVQARLQLAIAKPMHLAIVREINRGTPVRELLIALAASSANNITSLIGGTEMGRNKVAAAALANYALARITEYMARNLSDPLRPEGRERVQPMQGGRA